MSYLMLAKLWASIIAVLISGLFLWWVLTPPNVLNMLPFAIHEAINPGGSSETSFIVVFDVIIALLLLVFSYKYAYRYIVKSNKEGN